MSFDPKNTEDLIAGFQRVFVKTECVKGEFDGPTRDAWEGYCFSTPGLEQYAKSVPAAFMFPEDDLIKIASGVAATDSVKTAAPAAAPVVEPAAEPVVEPVVSKTTAETSVKKAAASVATK